MKSHTDPSITFTTWKLFGTNEELGTTTSFGNYKEETFEVDVAKVKKLLGSVSWNND